MCGFCGFTGQLIDREQYLRQMTEVITHRGPDSDGYYTDEGIAMGFRRLSIIDVEGAPQPLFNEDKSLVLMFNGEIYNYQDLRAELIELGHTFATEGDGETLLHGYEQWGADLLPRTARRLSPFWVTPTSKRSLIPPRWISICPSSTRFPPRRSLWAFPACLPPTI